MNSFCNISTFMGHSGKSRSSDVDMRKIPGSCKSYKMPDLNVEKISGPLSQLKDKATEQVNKLSTQLATRDLRPSTTD